jgi:mannose/fructose/N-acetylgalactosamine-specific phosphotransferase system component IIC
MKIYHLAALSSTVLFVFQVIAINGISLVGLPLSTCQHYIKVIGSHQHSRLNHNKHKHAEKRHFLKRLLIFLK